MRSCFLLMACLLCGHLVNAQCNSLQFHPTALSLNGVTLLDSSTVIAVGEGGQIIKSANGGRTWKAKKTYRTSVLTAIQFIGNGIGYVTGYDATLLKTSDGGEHWKPLYVSVTPSYTGEIPSYLGLFFLTPLKGFLVGSMGKLCSTSDGGRSWKDTTFSPSSLSCITFVNERTGFIGGNGFISRTTDGGQNWIKATINATNVPAITKIYFADSTTGYAVGNSNTVLKTIDGGITWASAGATSGTSYTDVFFYDAMNGFVTGTVGSLGMLLKTADGGNTWTNIKNPSGDWVNIHAVGADAAKKKVVLVGKSEYSYSTTGAGRVLLTTTDGGTTFTAVSGNSGRIIDDLFYLNDSTAYMTDASGKAMKTIDYGETWKPLHDLPVYYAGNPGMRIFFTDSLHGFAATDVISRTTDGGATWKQASVPGGGVQYVAKQVYFFDSSKGLVQSMGEMYKTLNGGLSWTKVLTAAQFFTDFTFNSSGTGIAIEPYGAAYISRDQGTTWSRLGLGTNEYLTSVYFYNSQVGFIGTSDSVVFRTKDGGLSWSKGVIPGAHNQRMNSFLFQSESAGFLLATSGSTTFYHTTDGGASWEKQTQISTSLTKLAGYSRFCLPTNDGVLYISDSLDLPQGPGYIMGPLKSCVGETSTYLTGFASDVNYNWSFSGGGVMDPNPALAIDHIRWTDSGQHTLYLNLSNACGTTPSEQITTDVILFQPAITRTDSILTASEGTSYQWYLNYNTIPAASGGKSRSILMKAPGTYFVSVTSPYGCTAYTTPYTAPAVLPIHLLSFDAVPTGKKVRVDWNVTEAEGVRSFIIERRSSTGNFALLDTVGAVTGPSLQHYSILDGSPLPGLSFYRLCSLDLDGKRTYSVEKKVLVSDNSKPVVYPNPVSSSHLTVVQGTGKITKVVLYDLSLHALNSFDNASGNQLVSMPVGSLKNGTYLLKIYTSESVYVQKVIVNR